MVVVMVRDGGDGYCWWWSVVVVVVEVGKVVKVVKVVGRDGGV